MRNVTEQEFFNVVNPLNVGPRVDVPSLKGRTHVSDWVMMDGSRRVIGRSETDSYGIDPTKFYLS